ncbi:MAG TPA: GNAT family N-acetyltransferase [Chitinophagales bacterium]|nr:GNAT family N-acetyltransferase [Chitinophagales bacterium]
MLETNFTPFPEIQTERLILRKFQLNDQQAVFEIRSNPEVMQYIPRPLAVSVTDALEHIVSVLKMCDKNEGINWAIEEKESNKLIGSICLFHIRKENYRAEVGYLLNPAWQHKGLMNEALQAVITFGFETMQLHSIEALIDPLNKASAKLLEKK